MAEPSPPTYRPPAPPDVSEPRPNSRQQHVWGLLILPHAVLAMETLLNRGLWTAIVDAMTLSSASRGANLVVVPGSPPPAVGSEPPAEDGSAGATTLDPLMLEDAWIRRKFLGLTMTLGIKRLSGFRGAVFDVAHTQVLVAPPGGGGGGGGVEDERGQPPHLQQQQAKECCVVIPVSVPELRVEFHFEHSFGSGSVTSHTFEINLFEVQFEARIRIPIISACCGLSSALDLVGSTLTVGGVKNLGIVTRLEAKLCELIASTTMLSAIWSRVLFSLCEDADDALYHALNGALEGMPPVPLCAYCVMHTKRIHMGLLPKQGACGWVVSCCAGAANGTAASIALFHAVLVATSAVSAYMMAVQCTGSVCVVSWLTAAMFSAALSLASALLKCTLYCSQGRGPRPGITGQPPVHHQMGNVRAPMVDIPLV